MHDDEIRKLWRNVLTEEQIDAAFVVREEDRGHIPDYDPWDIDPNEYYFDPDAAQHAADFFPACLKFVKGKRAGEPFTLEPWQRTIVRAIFGWKKWNCEDPEENGLRRYQQVIIYVPRKNGKSTFGAGLVLYLLLMMDEAGAEIYSAAVDAKQARIIFNVAKAMVAKEEVLQDLCRVMKNSIIKLDSEGTETNSFYQPISAEADSSHGYDACAYVVDELHNQPNRDLVDVLETSVGARTEPLGIYITTADFDRPSICNEKLKEAEDIIAGYSLDKTTLPVIYQTFEKEDWESEETWKKANPGYGVSLQMSYIKKMFYKAKANPDFENTFKRLHLNLKTQQARRWLQMSYWKTCSSVGLDRLAKEMCYGGLDLASTEDITAYVLYFPLREHLFLPWFFVPEENPKCKKEPYLSWINNGYLLTTPGNVTDYDYVRNVIRESSKLYDLIDIGVDPYNSTHIGMLLEEQDGITITPFPQTFSGMNEPCKMFSSMIKDQSLSHNQHPVFSWMASNVAIREDAYGNVRPDRVKSPQKIDGIVASLMALGRWMFDIEEGEGSKYEEEDVITL